jgi:hypothetical protein
MPLPNDFSPWEHLQNTLRFAHNQQVRREFDDIEVDDDISTPRGSLKVASLIDDKDTATMTLLRMFLYHVIIKGYGMPEIYSVPITDINDSVRYHPKIFLNFSQNYREVDVNDTATTGQISFRLMGKTPENLTQADVNNYAQRIKTLFGNSGGFSWRKGKHMLTYIDPEKGYFLQLLVNDQTEGKRIVEQVLDIQSHAPDWQYANYKENLEPAQAFPANPPNKTLVGKSRKQYKKRPVVTVRFKFAELHVKGLPNPYILYDKTGRYKRAILQD